MGRSFKTAVNIAKPQQSIEGLYARGSCREGRADVTGRHGVNVIFRGHYNNKVDLMITALNSYSATIRMRGSARLMEKAD